MPKTLQRYMSEVVRKKEKTPVLEDHQPSKSPFIKIVNSNPSLKDVITQELAQNPYVPENISKLERAEITETSSKIQQELVPKIEEQPEEKSEEQPTVIETVVINEDTEFVEKLVAPQHINESIYPEFIESLHETISNLKTALLEQQSNQSQLMHVVESLVESIRQQTLLTEARFKNVDDVVFKTAMVLNETTEKLHAVSIKAISIPAPIVNVALNEQKKIIKTVDRDENGLISKITEEIEQTVSQDK
jgi:hypothetical protein